MSTTTRLPARHHIQHEFRQRRPCTKVQKSLTRSSHNAPYKHFEGRNALLASVATRDFAVLTKTFEKLRQERVKPLTKLEEGTPGFLRIRS